MYCQTRSGIGIKSTEISASRDKKKTCAKEEILVHSLTTSYFYFTCELKNSFYLPYTTRELNGRVIIMQLRASCEAEKTTF